MDAYRKPGKRKKVPRDLRSWFIQNADGTEKGPFELDALISSGKAERLKPTTLVRSEDETEWQPLSALMAAEAVRKQPAPAMPTSYGRDAPVYPGSFGAGFCAGFFGGFIGLGLISAFAKGAETKRGAAWGLGCQFAIGILVRVLALGASTHD